MPVATRKTNVGQAWYAGDPVWSRDVPVTTVNGRELTAVGALCGIGSMLIGARLAGFRVVGNFDYRKWYHHRDAQGRNTFAENFPGAAWGYSLDKLPAADVKAMTGCDLLYGHPSCGRFSALDNPNKIKNPDRGKDTKDLPLFVDSVRKLRPRFFAMDNLPKSLLVFTAGVYAEALPEYDLYFEWVSNWGYGNVQKNRNRVFVIGALKSERWAFHPGESANPLTVADVIGDLAENYGDLLNHDRHSLTARTTKGANRDHHGQQTNYEQLRAWFADKRPGQSFKYVSRDGSTKTRIGLIKTHWDGTCHVLIGTNPILHPKTNLPLSLRERARVQGFPDGYELFGTKYEPDGWAHDKNNEMIRQTGRSMPAQFTTYLAEQVRDHLTKMKPAPPNPDARVIPSNPLVNAAKLEYCESVGYADQPRACSECWLRLGCTIRTGKYGLPPYSTADRASLIPLPRVRSKS